MRGIKTIPSFSWSYRPPGSSFFAQPIIRLSQSSALAFRSDSQLRGISRLFSSYFPFLNPVVQGASHSFRVLFQKVDFDFVKRDLPIVHLLLWNESNMYTCCWKCPALARYFFLFFVSNNSV